MSELSIFIDESGDFGTNSDYYLLTLVFHNQTHDISAEVSLLNEKMCDLGFSNEEDIHTAPIIRKEGQYEEISLPVRRAIFNRLYAFTRRSEISYKTFFIRKKEYPNRIQLKTRLARELSLFIRDNLEYFTAFEKVIVYYDNGQAPITELLGTVFASILFEVDFRDVRPIDYRLFQSADLFCTLELAAAKYTENTLSKSELIFFESRRKLKKNYLGKLENQRFSNS